MKCNKVKFQSHLIHVLIIWVMTDIYMYVFVHLVLYGVYLEQMVHLRTQHICSGYTVTAACRDGSF